MDGLSIIGVALGVGVVVYLLSLRGPDESLVTTSPAPGKRTPTFGRRSWGRSDGPRGEELGFGPEPEAADREPEPEGFVYVPVLASPGTHWQTRVGGVVGLMALVALAALAVALGVYQLGHVLNRMVQGFLGG